MACLRFVAAPWIVSHRTSGRGTSSEPSGAAASARWGCGEDAAGEATCGAVPYRRPVWGQEAATVAPQAPEASR